LLDRVEHAVAHAERGGDAVAVVALRFAAPPRDASAIETLTTALAKRLRNTDSALAIEPGLIVALLTGLRNAEDSASVAQELLAVLERVARSVGEPRILPVNAGIAVYPWDTGAPRGLLQRAVSIIPAPGGVSSSYHFASPLLQNRAARHQRIAHGLRHAVARGELSLLYQPQVDPGSSTVPGVEALLRWNNPLVGPIGPAHFISVAEHTGTIVPLGQWVLEHALQQMVTWEDRGVAPATMSVNVSPHQISPRKGPALTEVVERALVAANVEPRRLELEITESTGLLEDPFAIAELEAVARMGVGLAVDDFGKGYTSITYLRRLPLQRLKIDREFIEGLPWSTPDFVLVESLVYLARSFGLDVVAEGVTTHEQVATLRGFGCSVMQGFLYGHPLTPAEYEALMRAGVDALFGESEAA
jgi:diguanylate cyclase